MTILRTVRSIERRLSMLRRLDSVFGYCSDRQRSVAFLETKLIRLRLEYNRRYEIERSDPGRDYSIEHGVQYGKPSQADL